MKLLTLLIGCALPLASFASSDSIYGEDDRHDVYEYHDKKIAALAGSTVALFSKKNLKERLFGEGFKIKSSSLKSEMGVCKEERFSEQPATAFCSGFLVAPNKIMTAGHCITNESECKDVRLAFDYKMLDANTPNLKLDPSQVYSCKRIIKRTFNKTGADFTLIEIERPVTGRTPLKLAKAEAIKAGTEVFTIGHPSGLPAKITDSGYVRMVRGHEGYFVTNLDSFGGNSGSAVFNAKTLEVEGILVRGRKDYQAWNLSCYRSSEYDESVGSESVTLISRAIEGTGL